MAARVVRVRTGHEPAPLALHQASPQQILRTRAQKPAVSDAGEPGRLSRILDRCVIGSYAALNG